MKEASTSSTPPAPAFICTCSHLHLHSNMAAENTCLHLPELAHASPSATLPRRAERHVLHVLREHASALAARARAVGLRRAGSPGAPVWWRRSLQPHRPPLLWRKAQQAAGALPARPVCFPSPEKRSARSLFEPRARRGPYPDNPRVHLPHTDVTAGKEPRWTVRQ